MPTMQELQTETRLGALEGAMAAAVRDYKAELTAAENKERGDQRAVNQQEIDLLDDEEIDIIHKQRLAEMKREASRREEESKKAGHGSYNLVEEKNFLDEVTTSKAVVVHFFHEDFVRCQIVDKHMAEVARKYAATKFVRVDATKAPFFINKLKIQMLPCIVMFREGMAFDRIVGFDELGGVDDFVQTRLEKRLADIGMIEYKNDAYDSDEEEVRNPNQSWTLDSRLSTLNPKP
ncbi:thioredoxin-like protein [Baffinella frigidus]|nr:thioredoxin-like protein [Cryptophyta sp. CCMP2293]